MSTLAPNDIAAPPEHGHSARMPEDANPLDTPEVREAVVHALAVVVKPWVDKTPDPDEAAIGTVAVLDAVFAVLAPHITAAQAAAWRAGVEGAAAVCRDADKSTHPADLENAIRRLLTPAAFAAPEPATPIAGRPTEADLLWLCRHPDHSLVMIEIEGVFVPLIQDENGEGPVIPGAAP